MKEKTIKQYKNNQVRHPIWVLLIFLLLGSSTVTLVYLIYIGGWQLYIPFLVIVPLLYRQAYLAFFVQKLVVTNDEILVIGTGGNDKEVKISEIDYFTVIPNYPKAQMICYDIHGKKRFWDISYFFAKKHDVKNFIALLHKVNPRIKDKIEYDGMISTMLWGK